jgi:Putative prokaryotic signal transducing protein
MRRLDPEWVFLKASPNNADASLARALLDANGIECLIEGEHQGTILGPIDASFELRLLVRPRELEHAREVLAKAESQQVDEAELAELAASAKGEEAVPEEKPEKAVDPRQAARQKQEREMLRFITGMLTLLLTASWLLLRGTDNNLPFLLAPIALCALVYLRLRLMGNR